MPGERDGACEAFDCAYRSPIRREAGVQAFCANAADVRTASAGRLSASGEADARPASASSPAMRQPCNMGGRYMIS